MPRLLFVCTGNTCRSPLAAALTRAMVAERAVPVEVASAGISAEDGAPPSQSARTAAAMVGLELGDHKATRMNEGLLAAADLVLVMTAAHRDALHLRWPAYADRVLTLGDAAGLDVDVDDPYGGDVERYERTIEQVSRLLQAAWPVIARRLGV